MSPAITTDIKFLLPFVMLYTDDWRHGNLLTNDYTCAWHSFPLLLPPRWTFLGYPKQFEFPVQEYLLDGQFVPKSIETVIKRDIFHVWWHHASLILQTLLLRMLASLASKAQQAAEVGDCGLMHIHNVS